MALLQTDDREHCRIYTKNMLVLHIHTLLSTGVVKKIDFLCFYKKYVFPFLYLYAFSYYCQKSMKPSIRDIHVR